MNQPQVDAGLIERLHRLDRSHAVRLLTFVLLYAAAATGACLLDGHWLLRLPLYLLAAASMHGVSLFTHEAVHGTLSRKRVVNHVLGAACALPVLQNFAAYRVLHLSHHRHLGRAGDPDHYENYTSWTWLRVAMNWGRLVAGYPAYVTAIPVLGFWYGTARDRAFIALEVALLAVGVSAAVAFVPATILLHAWLIPMLVINTLVNVRGMSQHTLLEHADDTILGTRSILTNCVTAFFMCNENYHLEHHLYPGVPWYHLPQLHRALKPELAARGAPYIPSYFAFVREFVVGSVRRSPLGRWLARG